MEDFPLELFDTESRTTLLELLQEIVVSCWMMYRGECERFDDITRSRNLGREAGRK